MCDELQEWGRKSWNELYTGLSDSSITLGMDYFESDGVNVSENITMKDVKDNQIIVENIVRVFKRQYSLYKTTFRDGQDTAKRDFDLSKTMLFILPGKGATKRSITVEFFLPSTGESYFKVNLTKLTSGDKKEFDEGIRRRIKPLLYGSDLQIVSTTETT